MRGGAGVDRRPPVFLFFLCFFSQWQRWQAVNRENAISFVVNYQPTQSDTRLRIRQDVLTSRPCCQRKSAGATSADRWQQKREQFTGHRIHPSRFHSDILLICLVLSLRIWIVKLFFWFNTEENTKQTSYSLLYCSRISVAISTKAVTSLWNAGAPLDPLKAAQQNLGRSHKNK